MPKISVNLGENSYDISIVRGLRKEFGKKIAALSSATKVAVITDETVDALYGVELEKDLAQENKKVLRIAFKPGEPSKNIDTLEEIYNKLADFGMTRSDLIITLGGGVPGDMGGFAAATFLRGIAFVQIPTTLLAQIDSSVGGKVAIDLKSGKNLVGSFYQPKAVLIDPDILNTLPPRYLHDGLAEAIKYGAFGDEKLFATIAGFTSDKELLNNIDDIICTCCKIKANIVEKDEHDTGDRMVLNFGHTIGHAVEKCFNYEKYTHGEGVGIGMVKITKATEKLGITEQGTANKIAGVLKQYGLPSTADITTEDISKVVAMDKKKQGDKLTLVVLNKIGASSLLKINFQDLPKYVGE